MSLSVRSSRSRVLVLLTVGDEDELEEEVEQWLFCLESVLEVDESDPEDELDKPGTTTGTKFSVLQGIWIPFLMRCYFWPPIHFTRWTGFCMSELFRKIDFGGVMSWKTQPNCRASDDRRLVVPRSNSWSRFLSGRPDLSWLLSRLTTGCLTLSCQSFFFNMAAALLSSFFLDLLLGWSSTCRCAYEHFSPNLQPLFVL